MSRAVLTRLFGWKRRLGLLGRPRRIRRPRSVRQLMAFVGIGGTICVVLAVFVLGHFVFLSRHRALEEEQTLAHMEQTAAALSLARENLERVAVDWAVWDSPYSFMESRDPGFITENLAGGTLASIDVSAMVFLDEKGQVVLLATADGRVFAASPSGKYAGPPLSAVVGAEGASLVSLVARGQTAGFLSSPQGPVLAVLHSILRSDGSGPARGVLLVTRVVDRALLDSISRLTGNTLQVYDPADAALWATFPWLRGALRWRGAPVARAMDAETMVGFLGFRDLFGRPAAVLAARLDRSEYQESARAVAMFGGAVIAFWLGAVGTAFGLIRRLERTRRQQEATERRYQAVVEQSTEGMVLTDWATGKIIEANPAFCTLCGYALDDLIGLPLASLLDFGEEGLTSQVGKTELPGAGGSAGPGASAVGESGGTADEVAADEVAVDELGSEPGDAGRRVVGLRRGRCRRRDGAARDVEVSGSIVRQEESGRAVFWVVRDVTERVRAEQALRQKEEELRQAQKLEAVGQLAAGVAHDFNNMLTTVLMGAELLLARMGSTEKSAREEVEEIKAAALRGASLARQLMTFGKKQEREPRSLDLNSVVRGLAGMLRRVLGERVELVLDLDPRLGLIEADPGQMEQVLMNLVINARDAMPKGGTITIRTRDFSAGRDEADGETFFAIGSRESALELHAGDSWELTTQVEQTGAGLSGENQPESTSGGSPLPGRYVLLTVADTGVGMDGATLQRIFEPFFTTKQPGWGTGLGLSVVYGIVQQSGGSISVTSAVGKGT
ncbi:MAG: PAS domain S-box protein, partial [Thermoleophilia bacterium]|nr:PAS domain S-box protein [Thermoleophilia bacterium]